MAHANCTTVDCLVQMPAPALLQAWQAAQGVSRPLVDGVELLDAPMNLAAQGRIAPGVPVIAGSNLHDAVGIMKRKIMKKKEEEEQRE